MDLRNNIPKVIHYCWFGGKPLNKLAKKCLKSWRKFFPDYEIKEWNESNFDVNCCDYVKEAYQSKKWAFVSDYARFKILYENGGVYFDTDVETIKNFDNILKKGSFMGCENPKGKRIAVNMGLGCAFEPKNGVCKQILDSYNDEHFVKEDGQLNLFTIVERVTDFLKTKGIKDVQEIQTVDNITIYPTEYFCPIDMDTGKLIKTKNTYSIHHYMASWCTKAERFRGKVYRIIRRLFGEKFANKVQKKLGTKK